MKDQGIEPVDSDSVEKTKINKVWKNIGDKMLFLFDYGDDWRWIVTLKEFGTKDSNQKYSKLLKTVGKSPEQYPETEE